MNDRRIIEKMANDIGFCRSCKFFETDGDYGEIRCCNSDEMEEVQVFIEGLGDDIRCPFWQSHNYRCKEHKTLNLFDKMCDCCLKEDASEWSESNDSRTQKEEGER